MMILLLHRRRVLGAAVLLLLSVTVLSVSAQRPAVTAFSYTEMPREEVIVLDAGHGGADGGAVSADGTPEDDINLAIVLRLRDLFALMGRQTVLTRTGEASLADPDSTTLRQEKVSDTKNRVTLFNSVANGCLISIHQNTLPGNIPHCRADNIGAALYMKHAFIQIKFQFRHGKLAAGAFVYFTSHALTPRLSKEICSSKGAASVGVSAGFSFALAAGFSAFFFSAFFVVLLLPP